jgi:hypothetical protein
MSKLSIPLAEPSAQNLVFVSYSHADARWLERLRVHLKPLERQGVLSLWDDTRINPGTRWRDEIRNALEHARVAVLLVTADFLASDFIAMNELPPLLKAAENQGTLILPIIIKPCRFEQTEELSHFQAVNSPSKPLIAVRATRREELFVDVSRRIEIALKTSNRVNQYATKRAEARVAHDGTPVREAEFEAYIIRQLEDGTIEVFRDEKQIRPTKPVLREMASKLDLGLLNRNGNSLNTRQLGSLILSRIDSSSVR